MRSRTTLPQRYAGKTCTTGSPVSNQSSTHQTCSASCWLCQSCSAHLRMRRSSQHLRKTVPLMPREKTSAESCVLRFHGPKANQKSFLPCKIHSRRRKKTEDQRLETNARALLLSKNGSDVNTLMRRWQTETSNEKGRIVLFPLRVVCPSVVTGKCLPARKRRSVCPNLRLKSYTRSGERGNCQSLAAIKGTRKNLFNLVRYPNNDREVSPPWTKKIPRSNV